MLKKIIKYLLYTILTLVSLWIVVVAGLYFYLNSDVGQKAFIAYTQKSLKNSDLDVNIGKITGKIPFDFSIQEIEVKHDKFLMAKISGFSIKWHWKSLFYGSIHISDFSAKKIEIYIPKEKKQILGVKAKHNKKYDDNHKNINWLKSMLPPVSLSVEGVFIDKLIVYDKAIMVAMSKAKGFFHLSRFGDLKTQLEGYITKPELVVFQMKVKGPLLQKRIEADIQIKKSNYAIGKIKMILQQRNKGSFNIAGNVDAQLNKKLLGPASGLVGPLKIGFNLLYKKEMIEWKIEGGDGKLIQLDAQGIYREKEDAWKATWNLIKNEVKNLSSKVIGNMGGRVINKSIKKLKNKINREIKKALPGVGDLNLEGAIEGITGKLKGLFSFRLNSYSFSKMIVNIDRG